MVAELVETTRLWGRTAAAVDIRQVEPLAEHLVKRSYGEPRWDRRRAAVVASERVTLYGLPIVAVANRPVRADRPGGRARAVHPPRARRGRLGPAPRVHARERAPRGGGRGARGAGAAARPARERGGAGGVLRRADTGGRRQRASFRPLVEAGAADPADAARLPDGHVDRGRRRAERP